MRLNNALAAIAWTPSTPATDAVPWIDKVLTMCQNFGLVGGQFLDHMPHAFTGSTLLWLHTTVGTYPRNDFTTSKFKDLFLCNFTGQVRDPLGPHVVALEQLMQCHIQQGHPW